MVRELLIGSLILNIAGVGLFYFDKNGGLPIIVANVWMIGAFIIQKINGE